MITFIVIIIIAASVAAVDLYIKKRIEEKEKSYFPKKKCNGKVLIVRHFNTGFILNKFDDKKGLPAKASLIAFFAVIALFIRALFIKKSNFAQKLGIALIIGGGASNVYERVKKGYVTDYISIKRVKGDKRIIYNLGDFAIFAGAILTVFSVLFHSKNK